MISYSIYSGAGNSFVFFDNRKKTFLHSWVSPLCLKCKTDGVILLEESQQADYKMRIFNLDGSEAEMCGNGLRCLILYLQELNLHQPIYKIETKAGLYSGSLKNKEIFIECPEPLEIKWNILPGIHFLNTGVPHAVVFCDSVEKIVIEKQGKELRHHPIFGLKGTNVTFVERASDLRSLTIRTYERGVEGETRACGSGAIAAAFAAKTLYGFTSPISVSVRLKEILKIIFSQEGRGIEMSGPAVFLGKGSFSINEESSIMAI